MKILLHVCCGPCAAYPVKILQVAGHSVHGFFFNPNIHPYKEFRRRIDALNLLCEKTPFDVEIDREYGLKDFLRQVVHHEDKRCGICYMMRLTSAARQAKKIGADAFTSTLLYSRHQKHELIKKVAVECEKQYDIPFYYDDFRVGWQEGIDMAIEMGLYRQPYCGCIYSEQERYDKKCRK
jgi:hypothetical protein